MVTAVRPFVASEPELRLIELYQAYGDLRVKGSESFVVTMNGTVVSWMGRLFPPSQVSPPPGSASRAGRCGGRSGGP